MKISIDEIFGWSAACFSIIINFLSIKESILLYRTKAKYTLIPTYIRVENIINYFVCASWFMYSIFLKDNHLLICNSIGAIFFLFWIVLVFFLYFRKINCTKYFMFVLLAFLFIPFIYFMLRFSSYFTGKICAALYIISYFGYILEIKEIIRTKNFRIIKIRICILKLLQHICWFIYGFMIVNLDIVIPHVVGFILVFVSAFFWNIYKKRSGSERLSNRSVDVMRNRAEFTI